MIKKAIFILFLTFLVSCINLREDYAKIQYYRLSQTESTIQNIGTGTIEGTIQIRDFTVVDEIDTDNFLAISGGSNVQKYYYHRWISNCSDLITNFILLRYNNFRVFTGGAVKPGSMILPNYVLEGQVMDMIAHNNEGEDNKTNYVYISLRISLVKKVPLNPDKAIILNKIFTMKSPRKDNYVESIAPAFSNAVSQISDQMLLEIQEAIIKDRTIEKN